MGMRKGKYIHKVKSFLITIRGKISLEKNIVSESAVFSKGEKSYFGNGKGLKENKKKLVFRIKSNFFSEH